MTGRPIPGRLRRRPRVLDYDDDPPRDLEPAADRPRGEHQCVACGLPVDDIGELCPRCERH